MLNSNIDEAFRYKASQLHKKFYLLKEVMNFSEANDYVDNFKNYQSYFELFNQINDTTFDGVAYTYHNGQHFKKIPLRVQVSGLGMPFKRFAEDYEGKIVKLDHIRDLEAVHYREVHYREDDDIGAVKIFADEIYNEKDWQNHLVLLRAEQEWLQPNDL